MTGVRRHAALIVAAALVACGGAAVRTASSPSPSPTPTAVASPTVPPGLASVRLWVLRNGRTGSLDVVDFPTLHVAASMPAGVVAPGWTRVFSVGTDASGSALHVLDPTTGAVLDRVPVDAGMDLPQSAGVGIGPNGLSPAGRRLVLAGGSRDVNGRLTTSVFTVYDITAPHAPHTVSLPGEFTVDGIDDAGRNLWLLQWTLQPDNTSTVALRRYDLVHDILDPNPVSDRSCTGMSLLGGYADTVSTADGAWQLSLYGFGTGGPFVHALNLTTGAVRCIPLAHTSTSASASPDYEVDLLWSLVRSHDGRHFYAVNGGTGAITEITAAPPFHTRSATLPTPPPSPSPQSWLPFGTTTAEAKRLLIGGALLSPDDRTLYVAGEVGVEIIDTATLELQRTLLPDEPLESIALSPDGRWLDAVCATSCSGLYQLDTTTGAAIRIPQESDVSAVLRVTAAPG